MENVVKCWHCKHYLYFLEKSNEEAICYVKVKRVSAYDKVCEEFMLGYGIHTTRSIPKYCKHYNNE